MVVYDKITKREIFAKIGKTRSKSATFSRTHALNSMETLHLSKRFNICENQFNAENCAVSADILQKMFAKAEKLLWEIIQYVLHLDQ